MQTTATNTPSPSSSAGCCGAASSSGRWFANRKILLTAVVVVALGGAAAFGSWGWLVAAGLAPLLLSVLPCLVMCGLGLCMMRKGAGGGTANASADGAATAAAPIHRREGGVA